MQNLSDNVLLLEVNDELPQNAGEYIKILLAGSIDLSGAGAETGGIAKNDWITKFARGIVQLTDPMTGILLLREKPFILISTNYIPANGQPTLDNEEFVSKINWTLNMANSADGILINYLKKSQATWPLLLLGLLSGSGKCVVRCSQEYFAYGLVNIICQRNNIPLLPSATTSVYGILSTMQALIPAFQQIGNGGPGGLPE